MNKRVFKKKSGKILKQLKLEMDVEINEALKKIKMCKKYTP
jgi:hypothetical protein